MYLNLTVCSLGPLALELRKVAPSVLLVSFAEKTNLANSSAQEKEFCKLQGWWIP